MAKGLQGNRAPLEIEAVAHEVEAGDGGGDHEPGEDREPRRGAEILLRVVEHVAPARVGWLDAQAQIAEKGLIENDRRNRQRQIYDNDSIDVGQNVPPDNPRVCSGI